MTTDMAEWVTTHYADLLVHLAEETYTTGREHGALITGGVDSHTHDGVVVGQEDRIQLHHHESNSDTPVYVGVHTHPHDDVSPSKGDWDSFLLLEATYPDDTPFPEGWMRGSVIIGQKPPGEDTLRMTTIALTPEGAALDQADQERWIDAARCANWSVWPGLARPSVLAASMGPQVAYHTDERRGVF